MDISEKYTRYKKYLEFDPDNSLLLSQVIELALKMNDFQTAWSLATKAMEQPDGEPGCVYQSINSALATSHYQEALDWLAPLLESTPAPSWAVYNYAYALLRQNQHQELADYIESIENSVIEEIPQLLMIQAKAFHHLERFAESRHILENYINICSEDAEAYGYLSLVLLDMGHLSEAENAGLKGLSLDENQLYALISMGSVCLNHADVDAANQYCDAALKISPNIGRALSLKGQLLALERRYNDAIHYFERATQEMQHIGTWHGLAWCHLFLDQFNQCENAFKNALDLNPNFAESHGGMALAHVLKDDVTEAKKYLSVALKLDRHCVTGLFTKVILLRKEGKGEDADNIIQAILNSPLEGRDRLLKEAVSELLSKVESRLSE
jgi:tetratricopeptide (TPR) repeat protein